MDEGRAARARVARERVLVALEPQVEAAIERLAWELDRSGPPRVGVDPDGLLALALMYPVARFVLVHIGLPWLQEAVRYSELWRLRTDRWLDRQYELTDLKAPIQYRNAGDAAGEALKLVRHELEGATEAGARKAWERVRDVALKEFEENTGMTPDQAWANSA